MMPGKCPACGKYGLGCDRSAGCHECGHGRTREVPPPPDKARDVKPWQAEGFDPDRDMTPSGGERHRCGVVITMEGPAVLFECDQTMEGSVLGCLPPGWQARTTGLPGRPDLGYFYAVCPNHATPSPFNLSPEALEELDDGGAVMAVPARRVASLPDPAVPAPGSGSDAKCACKGGALKKPEEQCPDCRSAEPRVDACVCPPPDKQGAPGARSGDAPSEPTP